jgi:uncharacterized protein (DUF3820 family)
MDDNSAGPGPPASKTQNAAEKEETAVMNSSTTHSPSQAPTMPFGKFKGTPLDQLTDEYLLWLGTLNDLRHPLLGHVLREMGRRLVEKDRQPATRETGHE